jgi:hypothetical protein
MGAATTALGVVACETLYPEIEAVRPSADRRYVPQEYHEFPASVPLDAEIADRVRGAVADLDRPERERIAVSYATAGDGLRGVMTTHASLVVSRAADCVSTFTRGVEPEWMGESKASATYYLTRGWIDCGVDSYKLYRAYRGEESDLLTLFEGAGEDRRVTWADGDRYRRVVDRGRSMTDESIGRVFHDLVRYFERVVLIDTGHLDAFDHEYAETFRSFVERLKREHGDGGSVELSVLDGDLTTLRVVLGDDPGRSALVDVYPPGTPVG